MNPQTLMRQEERAVLHRVDSVQPVKCPNGVCKARLRNAQVVAVVNTLAVLFLAAAVVLNMALA